MFDKIKKLYRYNRTLVSLKNDDIKVLLKKMLPDDPVILEAGAHTGFDTVQMAILFPNAKIYAFEPIFDLYDKLRANTYKFKNIEIFPFALAQDTGRTSIYVSEGEVGASSSLLKPKNHLDLFPNVKFDRKIDIDTVNLDDWAMNNQISKIDFMWLDMQGYEIRAMKAGLSILSTVSMVFMEVSMTELYEGAELFDEAKDWMNEQGFRLFKSYVSPGDAYGNALFIR